MRRITAMIASIVLLMLALTVVYAETAEEEPEQYYLDGYTYILLEDGTAEIIKCNLSDTELVIPSELDGITVTSIGDNAFQSTNGLVAITFPDSINHIGNNPFNECTLLSRIYVPKDHPYMATISGVLFSKPDKRLICCPSNYRVSEYEIPQGIKIIGSYAFSDCDFKAVTIPNSVTTIGDFAFKDCYSLDSVTIPGSVTWIGRYAFHACFALTEITIEEGVTQIGDNAFGDCQALPSITFPNSITEIGDNPLIRCFDLKEIIVSSDHPLLELRDGILFTKTDHRLICYPGYLENTEYSIPEGTEIIGGCAFYGGSKLTTIHIPDSVHYIGRWAFINCKNLTEITIPEGVESIEKLTFNGCNNLIKITLPQSLTTINERAFSGCYHLKEISIPENVTTIEEEAFKDCSDLSELVIPEGVTYLGPNIFDGCNNLKLTVTWDSYAESYCKREFYSYVCAASEEELSWLND